MASTMARVDVTKIPWDVLMANMVWRQGEHVTLVGPTGCGKTTVALAMLEKRQWICVLATKPRDPLIKSLPKQGFKVIDRWPPPDYLRKVVLWPKISALGDMASQKREIQRAMAMMYRSGGWCVVGDELRYLTQTLGLKREAEMYWLQGRSLGISFVTATQRPAWVPLEAYDQATHLFLWRETDKRNLARLGDIGGVDTDLIRHVIPRLPKHDFLYINTRDATMCISNAKG